MNVYGEITNMPIKNRVILDLPCGPGDYVRKYFREGARKVITSDVVPVQVEISRKDREARVPEGFVKYYMHDARNPETLSETLADVCSCLHLFCFAKYYDQLRAMTRIVNLNLRPGGLCAIVVCSTSEADKEFCEALGSHDEKVYPKSTDRLTPKNLHATCKDFNLIRYVWPHDVICAALEE